MEPTVTPATLGFFVTKKRGVCLARKTDKIGVGSLCGHGGKIEAGESPIECLIREVRQETGGVIIRSEWTTHVAIMYFYNTDKNGKKSTFLVYVYLIHKWKGTIRATREMIHPKWYPKDAVPYRDMMASDHVWLPLLLNGCTFIGEAHLGPEQKTLHGPIHIKFVDTLSEYKS